MESEKSEDKQSMIVILSRDQRNMIGCLSIKTSTILDPGKVPKYVLNGIDSITAFGEHSVLLGVYTEAEDIEKEIGAIREAVQRGDRTYTLQYSMENPFG